ncbi:nucleotidyl transferase AbiEii/AbiGii toxin family protein [Candidatus Roizmanbacteria bacterium]|nr:nucleotidyl transferase AbiEii/AbiGii toxin family protein [Candidatus Roizmanbacteria bacterium]
MAKSLLSPNQKLFLDFVSKERSIHNLFYLTGGTALSEFYLHHRFSEDLDFFSEKEFDIKDVTVLLEAKKQSFGNPKIEFKQSFNRNIYQLIYRQRKYLKVEFTYFPFKRIDSRKEIKNIQIDSLIDIAVNKIFTMYQNPRGRDYFDLFYIQQKNNTFSFSDLTKLARNKFDTSIDYLQLGTNLIKVVTMKDDPILKKEINIKRVEEFFLNEAKKLKSKVFK